MNDLKPRCHGVVNCAQRKPLPQVNGYLVVSGHPRPKNNVAALQNLDENRNGVVGKESIPCLTWEFLEGVVEELQNDSEFCDSAGTPELLKRLHDCLDSFRNCFGGREA